MKKSLGFSLIEIMVALAISTILLAGVVSIFNLSKRTYTLQSDLSELQDNARFVMDNLIDELRVAGYTGCKDINSFTNPFFDSINPFGVTVNDSVIPGANSGEYPPSDRLVFNIDKAVQQELMLTPANETQFDIIPSNILLKANSNAVSNNWKVGIRDCIGVDYYQAAQTANTITFTPTPGRIYQTPLDIFMTGGSGSTDDTEFSTVMYEVRADDNGEFGLYKTIEHGGGAEPQILFVEGVQNIQVRYGIDDDGDSIPNNYNNIPPVLNAVNATIVSVRLTILMRTIKKRGIRCPFNKNLFLDAALDSYQPMEDNQKLEEGYCHRIFTTTIGIRNSIFPF